MAAWCLTLLVGLVSRASADPNPRPRPKGQAFSDDDLKKYKGMRTTGTPLPYDSGSVTAHAPRVVTPEMLAYDAAHRPYSRKVPVAVDAPGARNRRDEAHPDTSNPPATDN